MRLCVVWHNTLSTVGALHRGYREGDRSWSGTESLFATAVPTCFAFDNSLLAHVLLLPDSEGEPHTGGLRDRNATGSGMATAEAPARAVDAPVTLEYVEVYDEPLHPTVFENDYVRVLKVDCPSNQDTMLHRHSQDSFFLFFRTAQVFVYSKNTR